MKYTEVYWEDVALAVNNIPQVEKLFKSKIFITGVTGMLCSSVADLLLWLNRERGADIQLIFAGRDRESLCNRFLGFEEKKDFVFYHYDATNEHIDSFSVDYIIHGAGNGDPKNIAKYPVEIMSANFIGLHILLSLAQKENAKRVLYISSSEVYGKKIGTEPYREDDYGFLDILNPRACYPNSKRAAETLCVAYGAEYGVDTVIVRPGHIYGPTIKLNDSRASAQFINAAAQGKDIVMKSAGTQYRSYCYTLDCASAVLTALLHGKQGEAYNISNRDSIVSIRDIAEAVAKEADVKVVFEHATDQEMKSYNLMDNSSLNSSKLEKLGWKAEFGIEAGVRRTMQILKGTD